MRWIKCCADGGFGTGACFRKWHPDRNPDDSTKAEQKFREVGELGLSNIHESKAMAA